MHRLIYILLTFGILVFTSCGGEDIPIVPEPEPPLIEVPNPEDNEDSTEKGEENDQESEIGPEWTLEFFNVPEVSEDGWICISRPEQMAAFLLSEYTGGVRLKIVADLDMSFMPDDVISAVAASSRYFKDLIIDGSGCTITNYSSNAFLCTAQNLQISNLVLDNFRITSDLQAAGTLVNELRGSAVFNNVTVRNSFVSAADAGGLVGLVARESQEDRQEELAVSFEGCSVIETEVVAAGSAGKMVGRLSGYDNREVLSFDTQCSSSDVVLRNKDGESYSGPYAEGNEGEWLRETDFATFDNFLGDEVYGRGTVIYGNVRFVPQWDGHRQVAPLAADPLYDGWEAGVVIYSSYDLAYLQGKSLREGKYYLLADVDMGGDEGYIFESIADITYINGVRKEKMFEPQETLTKEDNNTIYNVKVVMEEHVLPGAAFILHVAAPGTRHMNLNFYGADVYNGTNLREGDVQYGNAYAGTVVSMVEEHCPYMMDNVHCSYGVIDAVCKIGGLIGQVCGNIDVLNCSVDNYHIKNRQTGVQEVYSIGPVYVGDGKYQAFGSQSWSTEGDVGGLIGFLASMSVGNAYIKGCSVTDTAIDCYGNPDKYVPISIYVWRKENYTSGPEGYYFFAELSSLVAGRHVNQFIGAIDSDMQSDLFVIEDYYVSGNSYFGVPAESADEYGHQYAEGKYCEVLGCAYYIGLDISILGVNLGHYGSYPGTLKFKPCGGEWVTVTEAPGDGLNMAWTGGGLEF
ncbi:MAG: hypothetical protein IIX08_06745 [Bacteroidales bacterium]|nr:hypothetical protein [Bacteroidales bacterium]